MTRELGYRHADELLADLTTRQLCDWIAVNAADPFCLERGDWNAARIAQCVFAAQGAEVALDDVRLDFSGEGGDGLDDMVAVIRREREKERGSQDC